MVGNRLLSLAMTATAGAAAVFVARWLYQSVIPDFVDVDRTVASVAVLFVLLVIAWASSIHGRTVDAAAFVGGGTAVWAVASARYVALCESGSLFRPCTQAELLTMTIPVAILAGAAYVLVVAAISRAANPR